MKNTKILANLVLSVSVGLAASACSSGTNTASTAPGSSNANSVATNANTATVTNTGGGHATTTTAGADDTPATVKAVFPDAQSFTKQHKDIAKDAVADIEKETRGKVPDTDHHSYLAFSSTGGARKQVGAATIVKANGKDMVIVYENKEGLPYIKEIRADGVPAPFLAQFAGKGHDDKFQIGADLKANGVDEATAKSIALAVRIDAMTMQTLYGAAHTH
jgi:hypothetical protein